MSAPPATPGAWRGSLRLRLLAGTLAWILGTIAVAGWGLSGLFAQHLSRQFHAELLTHLDQLTAVLAFDADGAPTLASPLSDPRTRRPYGGLYWQVERLDGRQPDGTPPLRSRSLWDGALGVPADHPADGEVHRHRIDGPDGKAVRSIERVVRPAERPQEAWRLVVAADETLLSAAQDRFTGQLLLALGVLAAGLVAAAVVQVRIGLRPLARLRDGLATVRRGEAQAIAGRFPSEIQPLVDEFNGVLARNAEVVARARTQAGNLAHALKTPLTVLANAAASEDGPLAGLVREQVATARVQVDHHLARARAAAAVQVPGLRCALCPVIEGLLRVMERVHAGRGIRLRLVDCPADSFFRGEEQDLQEMLGNLLDNACKWARSQVEVQAQCSDGMLRVTITDNGPGLPEDALHAVLERGVRADEHTPGSGLGLAIVRDLAQAYGGSVRLHTPAQGGLCAALHLPTA
ncbi:sensor histidine kinase [Thauera sp. CAU 1555]|uniref:histidine kinase n=1 Tax=Thauera sedimentorum TaxID=2767595 RepID=A0ABR9BAB8_9RHOO|nr:sensor histidine kinase [Thauera sedimentorum]MBC9072377.1 sensor histidine kinase [Thauera sedimentorum]MBD8503296.1 sensor histidine kinase [Thauera sedimentorum]